MSILRPVICPIRQNILLLCVLFRCYTAANKLYVSIKVFYVVILTTTMIKSRSLVFLGLWCLMPLSIRFNL